MAEGAEHRINTRRNSTPYQMGSTGGALGGWGWSVAGPNAAISTNDEVTQARARGLQRNSGYGWAAVEALVQRTVGPHGLQARPVGMRSRRNTAFLQCGWKRWAKDPKQVDFDRRLNLAALQDTVMRDVVTNGHVMVRMLINPDNADNPLQLRVISVDFLADHLDNVFSPGGGYIQNGIEYDEWGRVVAYHLYRRNPHERVFSNLLAVDRIPADEILHVFRVDFSGQQTGVTWLHPVGTTIRDRGLWRSAVLAAQQQSACMGVAIVDLEGGEAMPQEPLQLRPGMAPFLQPGQDIRVINPPSAQDHPEYDRSLLRETAAGIGVSYEALTGDLSQTNFSSARLGQNKFHSLAESWRNKMLIPQLLDPIWQRWVSLLPRSRRGAAAVEVEWIPPQRELIDPEKEFKAQLQAVRAGFRSLDYVSRQVTGKSASETLQEIAETNEEIDRLGLVLDSDPRTSSSPANDQTTADPRPEPGEDSEG